MFPMILCVASKAQVTGVISVLVILLPLMVIIGYIEFTEN